MPRAMASLPDIKCFMMNSTFQFVYPKTFYFGITKSIYAGFLLSMEHTQGALSQRAHFLLTGQPDNGRELGDILGNIVAEKLLIGHTRSVDNGVHIKVQH